MKKFLSIITIMLFTISVFAAEEKKSEAEKKTEPIGLSFGIDYYSTYLWRGTKFFSGDGAFIPKVSWNAYNTGLIFSVAGEFASSWIFNGFWPKPGKYSYRIDSSGNVTRKKLNFNHSAYATQSLDFGVDYSYTFKDAVTIGAGVWYWWYFNSRYAREYARPQVDGLNRVSYVDISFITTSISIGLPIVPYVNPTVSLTHDYYTGLQRGGDYYVQLSMGHSYELTKEVAIAPGITVSYYYSTTARLTHYNIMVDPGTGTLDTTPSLGYSGPTRTITLGGVKQIRTPLRKGFSDITPNFTLVFTKGPLSFNGGFYWCIVPAKSWYNGAEIHRYYAKVGLAYAI